MAIDTYANLQTTISDFLNRSDLTAIIPTFIDLCEAQLQREIRHYKMEQRATAVCDSQYTQTPTDFLEPIRLHISGQRRALQPMSLNEMQDERFASDDTAGEPAYYALTGGEFEVYPTPSDTLTLEMNYYEKIPDLSDGNTTNWLLDAAPDVYLYGSLMQSAPYLAHDERLAVWAGLYTQATTSLQRSSENAKWGANLRLRP